MLQYVAMRNVVDYIAKNQKYITLKDLCKAINTKPRIEKLCFYCQMYVCRAYGANENGFWKKGFNTIKRAAKANKDKEFTLPNPEVSIDYINEHLDSITVAMIPNYSDIFTQLAINPYDDYLLHYVFRYITDLKSLWLA